MRPQRFVLIFVFFSVLIFSGLVGVYLPKAAKTVYGGGDSGELITASYVLGVPHAPGYPLYTLIGAIFSRLPFPGSVAWKVNLTSSIFEAATATLVFGIIYLLTKRILIALTAALTLAFSYGFWFYGEFAEVFSLNNVFVSAIIFSLFLWEKTGRNFFLFLTFFLAGLSLTHHHTIVLLFLAIVIFIVLSQTKKKFFNLKNIVFSLILLLIPLSLYIYPVVSAKFLSAPIAWDNPVNFTNLFRLITRADYGVFQSNALGAIEQPGGRIGQVLLYFQFFLADFTILGLVLVGLGSIFLFFKDRKLFSFLTLAFLLTGPIFLGYANFPIEGAFEFGVIERFTLMSFIIGMILAAYGIFYVSQFIIAISSKINFLSKSVLGKYLILGIEIIFLILPVTLFLQNHQRIDLSKNNWASIFVKDVFASVPENSLLLVRGDMVIFNALYLQLVEGVRNDLKVISQGILPLDWYYYHNLPKRYSDLEIPQVDSNSRFSEFLQANSEKFQIFQYGTAPNVTGFVAIPHGLVWKLTPVEKEPPPSQVKIINDQIWPKFSEFGQRSGHKDLITEFTQKLYAEKRFELGRYFFFKENFAEAETHFEKSLTNGADFSQARILLAAAQEKNNHCNAAVSNYNFLIQNNPKDFFVLDKTSSLYQNCFYDSEKAQEFKELSKIAKIAVSGGLSLEEF